MPPNALESSASATLLPPALRVRAYRELRRLRLIEDRLTTLQRQGRVGSHLSAVGQEAVLVGAGLALAPQDWVFPALREGGVMLVRGFPLQRWLAQILGTRDDVLRGRQMPGHMSGRAVNQVAWSSVVGTQLSHAVGMAWAARRMGEDAVALAFLGDGATSAPDFHAALNFAAVLRVPCVFLCQNNQYAIGTPVARQTAAATLADKARAYAIPAERVDGNAVAGVYQSVVGALATARAGGGPHFIEAMTYRLGPHSTSDDPTRYRPESEVDAWSRRDPLARFAAELRQLGELDDALEASLEEELTTAWKTALEAAEREPPPPRETLFDEVYFRRPWHLEEQLAELMTGAFSR